MTLSAPTMDFSGSPNAPVYAENALAAEDAYNKAVTTTQAKQAQLYNQAGMKVTNNPDGSIASMSPDGLNPTGAYQQLQRGEGQALEARHEMDMSRGIGTHGIAMQPTSALRYANSVAQTNLGNNLLNANQSLVENNTNAFNNYQQTLLNLQLQSIADARATQNFPKENKSPNTPDPYTKPDPGISAPVNTASTVLPNNINAKTVKVGSTQDVDPRIIALAAAVAANKKKAGVSGYAPSSTANLH